MIIENEMIPNETARYSRHLILPKIGEEGQKKLKLTKVLIVGLGGLGSPLALYLSAAGIGTIGLADFDLVDFSNLQRQVIHGTQDVGKSKVISAKEKINNINPNVKVEIHNTRLVDENVKEIIAEYDIIADGTDNFETRYLINDTCVLLEKPYVFGAVYQFTGQVSVFYAKEGPCYRCLYPALMPSGTLPSCSEGGVLSVLPGIIGTIQSAEIIKFAIGNAKTLSGRLLVLDAFSMSFRELKLEKDRLCPICGVFNNTDA